MPYEISEEELLLMDLNPDYHKCVVCEKRFNYIESLKMENRLGYYNGRITPRVCPVCLYSSVYFYADLIKYGLNPIDLCPIYNNLYIITYHPTRHFIFEQKR